MSGTTLGAYAVRDAVEKAGFALLPHTGLELRDSGNSPSSRTAIPHQMGNP
jgi:hypothetical protein